MKKRKKKEIYFVNIEEMLATNNHLTLGVIFHNYIADIC